MAFEKARRFGTIMKSKANWVIVYLGLGSNIGSDDDIIKTLIKAMELLNENENIFLTAHSRSIKTAPWGGVEQPDFFNMVAEIRTCLDPLSLLEYTQGIEIKLGRKPNVRWGPRIIDIDILLFENKTVNLPNLVIPHLYLTEREFMWGPLLELNPLVTMPDGRRLSTCVLK